MAKLVHQPRPLLIPIASLAVASCAPPSSAPLVDPSRTPTVIVKETPKPQASESAGPPCEHPPRNARRRAPTTRPTQEELLDAVLTAFPKAYRDLATLRYEHVEGRFTIDRITVLLPEAQLDRNTTKAQQKAKACEAKKQLGFDCACESVAIGKAVDYAWSAWPDKRVVPITISFGIGC